MDDVSLVTDEETTLRANAFTRPGYTFTGWATTSGGDVVYADKASFTMGSSDVTLYARWRELTIRDIGPSGGYIFYDKNEYTDGWRYLEAAPAGWNGTAEDPKVQWGVTFEVFPSAKGLAIGTGKTNTANIVSYNSEESSAAIACNNYSVVYKDVQYDDWFLPSKEELIEMCNILKKNSLGSFSNHWYWSSSEYNKSNAMLWSFKIEQEYRNVKTGAYHVRPVRAF